MAGKKTYKKKNKRQTVFLQKLIRFLFVVLIIAMAGFTLAREYRLTRMAEEEQVIEEQHESFISRIAPISQEMQQKYGGRASISIAQAILESDWGKSDLSALYHNLYGIKGNGPEDSVLLETTEFVDGEPITVQAYFKVYDSIASSVEDHAKLMAEGTSWDAELYWPVIKAGSYQEAAHALQESGYATDPDYPEKVIEVVERYELYQYDLSL